MADRQIRYGIGFDVDSSGLQQMRSELMSFQQNLNLKDLKLVNKDATIQDLNAIKQDAQTLGDALEKSFNPRLGTVNIDTFNNSLKASGRSVKDLEASLAKAGPAGKAAFRNMTAELFTTQKAVKQTSSFIDSMAKTLFNTIKWSIASGAINTVTSAVRNAWNYTVQLDSSLNDIRIVTEKSSEEMERFAGKANKAAKSLGAATTAYTKASLIYYQQGLDEEDVQARTDVTLKAANVTGQSASEVSEQLTAVWNGYRVVAEDAERYIDKLSAVAASTASDLEELSEGMSKVASGANAMGVDIDQLTAQLSTIISVTRQDASSVGTALKTIFARMGDLKVDGVDEFGVSLGDVSGTLKKVGVEVLDQQGNLRDMGTVMEDVAGKWGTWTEAQQQAVAVAMAGKRQYNNLLALFENWDMYESALTTSQTSEGTLQKQQDIYMDSLDAKLQQLSTSGEKIYKSLFDSNSMKDFIDVLTVALDGLGQFIDGIGGGGNILLMLASTLGKKWSNEIAMGIGRAAFNMEVMKENALQVKAETLLMSEYENINETAMEKMVALKKEQLKANEYLTEEEKEQYNYLIKQTAELYNQKDALKQEKEDTDKFFTENYEKPEGGQEVADLTDDQKKNYLQTKLDKLKDPQNANITTKDYTQQLRKDRQGLATGEDVNKSIDDTASDLQAQAQGLRESDVLTAEEIDKVTEAELELTNAQKELAAAGKDEEKAAIARQKVNEKSIKLNSTIQKGLKNSEKAYEKNIKVLENNTKAQNKNTMAIEDAEKASAVLTNAVNFKMVAKGVTEVISSVGQLASAFSMLSNIDNILNDKNLSDGEKFLQIASALTPALFMLKSGLSGVKTGFDLLTQSIGFQSGAIGNLLTGMFSLSKKKREAALESFALALGIDAETIATKKKSGMTMKDIVIEGLRTAATSGSTIATWALTIATWALTTPMLVVVAVIALIIAGIVALIAAISAIVKAIKADKDNGAEYFNKMSEAAQQATERFNETKQAYEDLKKSLEDYNNAQKAIDEMTKGTEEWKNAIQEANMQVIDLIDKYPELAQYVSDVNGQLKISEEGQEAVLQSQKEEMNLANRGRMVANIEKAKAENSMIEQTSANKVLKTDDYNGWAGAGIGAGIGTAVGALIGPLGAVIGGVLGATVGGIATAAEQERREDAYNAALGVIEENGNAILGDKSQFEKEMLDAGVGQDLIDALWENKEELAKNSAEIAANNAAIKLQQQQIAASYLEDKSEAYRESEQQQSIAKIIANNSNTESQAYKDELAKIMDSSGDINTKDEAKNVFEQSGINGTFKEFKDGMITYVDENGDEKQVSADSMAKQIAQEKALTAVSGEDSIQKIEMALDKVSETFGKNIGERAGSAITNFVAGEKADLSSLTQNELEKFDEIAISKEDLAKANQTDKNSIAASLGFSSWEELEENAKTLGYDSASAYLDAMQTSVNNYKFELEQLTLGFSDSARKAFNSLKQEEFTKDWSLATQKAVAGSFEEAFKKSGPTAVSALKSLYSDIGGSMTEEDLQALTSVANKIDWSSSSAIMEFNNQLKDLNINIPTDALNSFIGSMSTLVNVANEVMNNLDGIRSKFKELGDLTKDLKLGDTISDEDYKNLIKYNRELENYFVMTADGYKYLGGADDTIKATKMAQLDINKLKDDFGKAKSQGQSALSTLNDDDKTNDIFNLNAKTKASKTEAVEKIVRSGKYSDLLAASGYTQEQLNEAINTSSSKFMFNGKDTGLTLADIKGMKASELAEKLGISTEAASEYISNAAGKIKTAEEIINNAYSGISGTINSIKDGSFDEKLEESIGLTVSSLASTYEELKEYKNEFAEGSEVYLKLAKSYLAEEAAQLGFNTKLWEEMTNKTLEDQEAIIERRKLLNSYDEVDYYKEYSDQIDKTNKKLDVLSENQENLMGTQAIANLKEQISLQTTLADNAKKQYDAQLDEMKLRREELNLYTESLSRYGVSMSYNNDGSVSNETRDALIKKLNSEDLSDAEKAYVQEIINDIDSYNDKLIEVMDNYQKTFSDSIKATSDALLEIFDQKLSIQIEFSEIKREIEKFKDEIEKILVIENTEKASLSFFEEGTAKDMYDSAYDEIGSLRDRLALAEGDFNERTKSYSDLENWLGTGVNTAVTAEHKYKDDEGKEQTVTYSLSDVKDKDGNVVNKSIYSAITAQEKEVETARAAVDAILNDPTSEYNKKKNTYDQKVKAREAATLDKENAYTAKVEADNTKNLKAETLAQAKTDEQALARERYSWLFSESTGYKKFTDEIGYDSFDTWYADMSDPTKRAEAKEKMSSSLDTFSHSASFWEALTGADIWDTMTVSDRNKVKELKTGFESDFSNVDATQADYDAYMNGTGEYEGKGYNDIVTNYNNKVTAENTAIKAEEEAEKAYLNDPEYVAAYNAWVAEQKELNDLKEISIKLEQERSQKAQKAMKSLDDSAKAYLTYDETTGEFGKNELAFKEDMKESWDMMTGYYNDINEQLQNIYDSWGKAQEEILAAYDKEIEKRSTLNSLYSSAAELYSLVGKKGSEYAEKMSGYYQKMTTNAKSNYDLAKAQFDAVAAQYEQTKTDFKDGVANQSMMDTVEANYNTALENMMSTATEWANALKEQLSASLSATIDEFVAKSNELGLGLSEIQEEWGRATQNDERYLDDVNATYAIDNVERNFKKSIDETDSYAAQKKLNGVMQEQLKLLREKDKLSQYDIDRANAMYELTLKQIALEEAQNTANKMKLTRDASGNYSYQYVADQDAIAKAEEELAKAQNDLYNLDKERQKSLVDDYYNIMSEAQEAISNASEENRANVAAYYEKLLKGIQSELGISTDNLNEMGNILTNNDWTAPFEDFVNAISKDNVDSLFTDIYSAIDGASGLNSIINDALGEGSSFNSAMTTLTSNLVDVEDVNEIATNSAAIAQKVVENLPGLLASQKEIEEYVTKYEGIMNKLETNATSELDYLANISTATQTTATNTTPKADGTQETTVPTTSNESGILDSDGGK